jgi:4'-phosphopantetheinyl transferase
MTALTPFTPATAPQPLADDALHVWLLPLAPGTGPAAAQAATARANAFLCDVLAHYLDRDVGTADFVRGESGKPALREPARLGFNLSHCARAAVVALALDVEVGVDVECLGGRERPYAAMARRYFRGEEAQWIAAQPAERLQKSFLDLWTAKEAVLKATGRGIAFGLDRLRFAIEHDRPARLAAIEPPAGPASEWQVHALRPWPGFAGAVAWRGTPRRVALFEAG